MAQTKIRNEQQVDGSQAPLTCSVMAYVGSDYTLSGTTQEVAHLNTEGWDIGGDFNTTTYKFTAPVTGYYQVNGQAQYAITSAGERTVTYITSDNGGEQQSPADATSTNNAGARVGKIVKLTAGDDLWLGVRNASNGSDTIRSGADNTFLTVVLIGT